MEIKRANRHWLAFRLIACLVLMASFCFLAIPLHYQTKSEESKDELILITPGFSSDSIRKLKTAVYYSDETLHSDLKARATFLPDLSYYLSEHPSITEINVHGYGLPEDDLKKIKDLKLQIHRSKPVPGIVACNWLGEIVEGESLVIQGVYNNPSSKTLVLKMTGFGSVLDSFKIAPNAKTSFTLQQKIRQKGKAIVQLIAFNGNDIVSTEIVPFQSIEKAPLKLLMLMAFPGFESKFIKNWLFENGYSLAFRSEISKEKYSTDFLNRKAININQLQASMLNNEDVLIIDQATYENVSASQRSLINSAVSKGLGILVLADENVPTTPLLKNLNLFKTANDQNSIRLSISDNQEKLFPLPFNQQIFLRRQTDHQNLIVDQKQRIIAAQRIYGQGKFAITTFQNSYQWSLMGKQRDYARYWSSLISAVARKKTPAFLVTQDNRLPIADKKLTFNLSTQTNAVPEIRLGSTFLQARQNLIFPSSWKIQTWLAKEGWNTVMISQKPYHFYVYNSNNWKALKATELLQANQQFALNQKTISSSVRQLTINTEKEVSKWYFFLAFVLAASFLWFESRIFDRL